MRSLSVVLFVATGVALSAGAASALVIDTPSPLPSGSVSVLYNAQLTASGALYPPTWSIMAGDALPPGLSLDSFYGYIYGTPTNAGTSSFTVQATDGLGSDSKAFELTIDAALGVEGSRSARSDLGNPAPNPFQGTVRIPVTIASPMHARVEVLDLRGRALRELLDQDVSPGRRELLWDGLDGQGMRAGSGVYFVRMKAGPSTVMRRILLVR